MIEILPVETENDKLKFIKFQYQIYRDSEHFVPPLIMDRKKLLDKKKNPFYKDNAIQLYLAYRDGKIVGRIAAIENKKHNEIHNENSGFFGFYESINDVEVAKALIDKASEWCKNKGFSSIIGPVNPHLNDDSPGFLAKGFDDDPVMLLAYSQPYYLDLMDACGLAKIKDLYSYRLEVASIRNIDKMKRINERVKKRHNLNIRPINMKKFDEEYLIIQEIFNRAWEKNWGQVPLTKEDFEYIASDLKSLIHLDFVRIAFKDDTAIGMTVAFPDVNHLLKPMNGTFLSWGVFNFLKYVLTKKSSIRKVRVFILGVLPEYDHTGATSLLYTDLIESGYKHKIVDAELAWILEDNDKMNKAAEMLGGVNAKTYRLFSKRI
ncbi:MAG: hypothetical protein KDD94_13645 [Calditrichaeota bacterium]|nr:hypothetical protein [Calditrichota bacterium]